VHLPTYLPTYLRYQSSLRHHRHLHHTIIHRTSLLSTGISTSTKHQHQHQTPASSSSSSSSCPMTPTMASSPAMRHHPNASQAQASRPTSPSIASCGARGARARADEPQTSMSNRLPTGEPIPTLLACCYYCCCPCVKYNYLPTLTVRPLRSAQRNTLHPFLLFPHAYPTANVPPVGSVVTFIS
jgi:hypothetical protein